MSNRHRERETVKQTDRQKERSEKERKTARQTENTAYKRDRHTALDTTDRNTNRKTD